MKIRRYLDFKLSLIEPALQHGWFSANYRPTRTLPLGEVRIVHDPTRISATAIEKNLLDAGTHSGVDTWDVPTGENPRQTLRAGALSKAAGVSTDTLRHYEKLGLLQTPPRTASGYRAYPRESIDRVRLIRNALACGFTLKELATVLRVKDAGGAPCRKVAALAHEKVQQLTTQIAQLTRLRDALQRTTEEWDRRLENVSLHDRADLLQSLTSNLTEPPVDATGAENENASSRRRPRSFGFGLGSQSIHVPDAPARNVG